MIKNNIMDVKEKAKDVNLRFYNVVIHPSDKHEPRFYVNLFDKIHEQGKVYNTGNDKKTKLRIYSKANEVIQCTLINYTTLGDDNWYDETEDKLVKHEIEPNIYPHAKEWDIYFLPAKHRMAIVAKRGLSWGQIESYFTKAFEDAGSVLGYDEVKLTQETSQEGIDEIFKLESIDSIEIEVSYSNNDINDLTEAAIDSEFKRNNVSSIKTKATGTKGKPLTLHNDDSYMAALVKLSRHNGYAKAIGKIGRKQRKVNTRDYPMVSTLKKVTSNNIFQKVKDALSSLF